ncbi:MAG: DUF1700 domain-containing protein [Faecalimonas sp.]|nr:DUF1700 domain-containing protein [Faecalimonas sp.]
MNRAEFMRRLEELLSDVSESDRQDAISYYNDYFDEAGKEKEEQVIRELGSPEQVARTIRAERKGAAKTEPPKAKRKTWLIVLLVVLGVFALGGFLLEEILDDLIEDYYTVRNYPAGGSIQENPSTQTNQPAQTVQETFTNLDIELGVGELELCYGDVEQVQIEQKDVTGFKSYVKEYTLCVEGGKKVGINQGGGHITIVIPRDMTFEEVDLEIGAGKATVDAMLARELDIQVGAGKATLSGVDVNVLSAEVGAGELAVQLVGAQTDYNYDVECGMGDILIGSGRYTGIGSEQHFANAGAMRNVELECGIGKLQLSFEK